MAAAGIPTAASRTFEDLEAALRYVDAHPEPLVVKASGLAAGKGAVVCPTRRDAAGVLRAMLGEGTFGDAGRTVVVESFLQGEEISVLAITDGRDFTLLPVSQDHKRLQEGDSGPNTGGMGAYSPVSVATPALLGRVEREVLVPALEEMERRGNRFAGVLYAGSDGGRRRHAMGRRVQLPPRRSGDPGRASARVQWTHRLSLAGGTWRGRDPRQARHGRIGYDRARGRAVIPMTRERETRSPFPPTCPPA